MSELSPTLALFDATGGDAPALADPYDSLEDWGDALAAGEKSPLEQLPTPSEEEPDAT